MRRQLAFAGFVVALCSAASCTVTASTPADAQSAQHHKTAGHDRLAAHGKTVGALRMRASLAPDRTGSIAAPIAPPPVSASAPPDRIIPPPYHLPEASRERVRQCGEIWRAKKLAGATGDDDWRDFALNCLVAQKL